MLYAAIIIHLMFLGKVHFMALPRGYKLIFPTLSKVSEKLCFGLLVSELMFKRLIVSCT